MLHDPICSCSCLVHPHPRPPPSRGRGRRGSSFPTISVRGRPFSHQHGLCHSINLQPIVVYLLDFMPFEASGVFNWVLESRYCLAISNHIKPITIPAVFSDSFFVWRKENTAGGLPYSRVTDRQRMITAKIIFFKGSTPFSQDREYFRAITVCP